MKMHLFQSIIQLELTDNGVIQDINETDHIKCEVCIQFHQKPNMNYEDVLFH
jgi:hypothetical protein